MHLSAFSAYHLIHNVFYIKICTLDLRHLWAFQLNCIYPLHGIRSSYIWSDNWTNYKSTIDSETALLEELPDENEI